MSANPRKTQSSSKRFAALFLLLVSLAGLVWWRMDWIAALFSGSETPDSVSLSSRPDLVVIVLDTARFDSMISPQNMASRVPDLQDILGRSRVYKNAYATSGWTVPSHASMLTGLYPNVHKSDQQNWTVSRHLPFLPELLADQGYFTVSALENPMLYKGTGFERGFEFRTELGWHIQSDEARLGLAPHFVNELTKNPELADRPMFLLVNLLDPHYPYTPYKGHYKKESPTYEKAIEVQSKYKVSDWYLKRLRPVDKELALLRTLYDLELHEAATKTRKIVEIFEKNRNRDCVFLIVSDHGEHLGEKGLYQHVFSLSETLVHIPFLLFGDGIEPGIVEEPVSLVDVFPTFLSLAKAPPMTNEGIDLLKQIDPHRPLFISYARPKQALDAFSEKDQQNPLLKPYLTPIFAVLKDGHKLVRSNTQSPALYDLSKDPAETQNLFDQQPALARQLGSLLDAYQVRGDMDSRAPFRAKVDEKTKEMLRSLGYLH